VQGIFPPGCDGSHVNTVAVSPDQSLICSGDDYGLLTLYRNPCLDGHAGQGYRGHSEHVTQVEFSDNGRYILSVGGQDQTTIQWKRLGDEDEDKDAGFEMRSPVKSESPIKATKMDQSLIKDDENSDESGDDLADALIRKKLAE